MLNVRRILRHEGQMSGLPRRAVSVAVDGATERLMVRVDDEAAPLHMRPEVFDSQVEGKELPVKRTVFPLRRGQLLREESEGFLSGTLTQDSTNGDVRGIRGDRQPGGGVGVYQKRRP